MKLSFGPGALVAAAFIGPGTVTACTVAGADFGFALVWALVFATLATIILQSMAARLGLIGGVGLGESMMAGAGDTRLKALVGSLVLAALFVGNCAYEGGNLTGAALGLEAVFSGADAAPQRLVILVPAVIAAAALWAGKYRALERGLIGLVLLMSLTFLISAILVRPDLGAFVGGLVPKVPDGALLTAIALIGTTIVPYNLFLHAAAVRARWPEGGEAAVANALRDTRLSIGLGGVVSLLILSTAASALFQSGLEIRSAQDMAIALQPVAGDSARILIGVGLAAAGLTSAITAPMATAYAVSEVFGLKSRAAFRSIALTVLFVGTAIGLLGIRPVQLILVAQAANGLLLPIVAVFLLVAMNRTSLLGDHVNRPTDNLLGGLVVLVSCGLGLRLILRAIGIWP